MKEKVVPVPGERCTLDERNIRRKKEKRIVPTSGLGSRIDKE